MQALTSLGCMEHRGACSADNDSGDGAGLMTQIPWDLLKEEFPNINEKTTGCAGCVRALTLHIQGLHQPALFIRPVWGPLECPEYKLIPVLVLSGQGGHAVSAQ